MCGVQRCAANDAKASRAYTSEQQCASVDVAHESCEHVSLLTGHCRALAGPRPGPMTQKATPRSCSKRAAGRDAGSIALHVCTIAAWCYNGVHVRTADATPWNNYGPTHTELTRESHSRQRSQFPIQQHEVRSIATDVCTIALRAMAVQWSAHYVCRRDVAIAGGGAKDSCAPLHHVHHCLDVTLALHWSPRHDCERDEAVAGRGETHRDGQDEPWLKLSRSRAVEHDVAGQKRPYWQRGVRHLQPICVHLHATTQPTPSAAGPAISAGGAPYCCICCMRVATRSVSSGASS